MILDMVDLPCNRVHKTIQTFRFVGVGRWELKDMM